jgi:hypothetical protein
LPRGARLNEPTYSGTALVHFAGEAPVLPTRTLPAMLARRLIAAAVLALPVSAPVACRSSAAASLSSADRQAIGDTLRRLILNAYDLSKPDVVNGLASLYPDRGRVISATAGRVSTSRDSLIAGIRYFWEYVGKNMQHPQWQWGPMYVDVLAPDAAVLTTSYRVPHHTPNGEAHVIGGAWTAVFVRRDSRWQIVQEHLSDIPAAQLADTTSTVAADTSHKHR